MERSSDCSKAVLYPGHFGFFVSYILPLITSKPQLYVFHTGQNCLHFYYLHLFNSIHAYTKTKSVFKLLYIYLTAPGTVN